MLLDSLWDCVLQLPLLWCSLLGKTVAQLQLISQPLNQILYAPQVTDS